MNVTCRNPVLSCFLVGFLLTGCRTVTQMDTYVSTALGTACQQEVTDRFGSPYKKIIFDELDAQETEEALAAGYRPYLYNMDGETAGNEIWEYIVDQKKGDTVVEYARFRMFFKDGILQGSSMDHALMPLPDDEVDRP